MMWQRRSLIAGAVASLAALVPPAPARAAGPLLTREDAIGIFEKFISTDRNEPHVDAFMPQAPLPAGAQFGAHFGENVRTLPNPTWLAYIDDDPLAKFGHDVRYMLIDAVTGDVQIILEDFYPAVDGVPIWYENEENVQYTNGDAIKLGDKAPMPPMTGGAALEAPAVKKEPTTWAVVIGGPDQKDKRYVPRIVGALRTNPGIPEDKIKSKACATKQDLCDLLAAVKGCDKLYFCITTHGQNTKADGVQPWRVQLADGWIEIEDVIDKLAATGAAKICIVAETCYSGCFIQKARGKIDADIATACSRSVTSGGWTTWTDSNNDGIRDGGEVRSVWHYLEEFLKCLQDPAKKADMAANGGDGDGKVEWPEAHNWAKTIIETPSGTPGTPGSGSETGQAPQYETTFKFDTFLWSGGQGVSGGQGCTKLDLYNPSCTETRMVDWSISLPGPGLTQADGVMIVDQMGSETLGPKEKKSIKIRFTFPPLPGGGIIFPKATVKIAGTPTVIGCDSGCVRVPVAATEPAIDNIGESSYIPPPPPDNPGFGQLMFRVEIRSLNLVGQPLFFETHAANTNPENDVVFQTFPPFLQLMFNHPGQSIPVQVQVMVPPGTPAGTANEIFLQHLGGTEGSLGPVFASLGAIVGPALPAGDCNLNSMPDAVDIAMGFSLDCNGNGFPDECDTATGASPDCNFNGVPDECDVGGGGSLDVNGDGVPDECQDCNMNGMLDPADIAGGFSDDCNSNGTPDECEFEDCNLNGVFDFCDLAFETSPDCNGNNIPDSCDIAGGSSIDANGDGLPDECQDCNGNGIFDPDEIGNGAPDCNANGVPDDCEVGDLEDCDANGIPDECYSFFDCNANGYPDICELVLNDCDGDGLLDSCEIDSGSQTDANDNGLPDECEMAPPCDGDLDGSGVVGFADLSQLLNAWGHCPGCPEDFDGNGAVGFADLNILLANWGPC